MTSIDVAPGLTVLADPVRHVEATSKDISAMADLLRRGARIRNEDFETDTHLSEIIPKPWGCEYRTYVDDLIDVWALHIEAGQATSMHVHPRKLTYLLCLGGQGFTTTLRDQIPVRPGTMLRIAGGAFHGTQADQSEPLTLLEVEVPRNKSDLMRLRDRYARVGQAYETGWVLDVDCPLRTIPYLPNAAMRRTTHDGRFTFDIRAAMDLYYRPRPHDLFHVPLGVAGVIRHDLDIITAWSPSSQHVSSEQYYLSIADNS